MRREIAATKHFGADAPFPIEVQVGDSVIYLKTGEAWRLFEGLRDLYNKGDI